MLVIVLVKLVDQHSHAIQAKLSRCSWCTSTPAFHAGDHHMLVPVYKIFHQGRYWVVCYMVTYTSRAVAVSHDQVECSTSLTPVAVHTAAAVMKNLLTQVCTLLSLLLKQQVAKLKKKKKIKNDCVRDIFNITYNTWLQEGEMVWLVLWWISLVEQTLILGATESLSSWIKDIQ